VVPDRVVAATYLAAAGMTGGDVTIADARPDHMEMLLRKVNQMGVVTTMGPDGLRATAAHRRLVAADVATLPYPGVATDYSPLLVAMLTGADGVGILTENLFSGRFRYVEELRRMGADIKTEGHHAVVRGVPRLSGARVRAPRTSGPGSPWCWPAWWPRGRPPSPAPTTSAGATRTWLVRWLTSVPR
jgi:UDP-N-acetylglucosamine 1-carboxyvinyltransferase